MSGRATTRIYQPKDYPVFRAPIQTCGANAAKAFIFSIPTPSARLLTKIALFWWPLINGQPTPLLAPPVNPIDVLQNGALSFLLNLWSAEPAETGWLIPTTDLVGTLAGFAGQSVPVTGAFGLAGFSLDVQGGQSAVGGLLICGATVGYNAVTQSGINISLRVRYEASSAEMCQDEWESLLPLMQPTVPPPVIFT